MSVKYDLSLEDFYEQNGCHNELKYVTDVCPITTLSALDDPLVDIDNIALGLKYVMTNENITAVFTETGGHLGFECGKWICNEFFKKVIADDKNYI